MRRPSGENVTDQTESVCPVNGPASASPVVVFHIRIVPSHEPETIHWPSGEKATDQTEPVYPVNGLASVSPVVAFQTRIVPLEEPETMRWPSGESAMERTTPPTFEITISNDVLRPGTVLFIFLYFTPCLTFSLRLMVTHR